MQKSQVGKPASMKVIYKHLMGRPITVEAEVFSRVGKKNREAEATFTQHS